MCACWRGRGGDCGTLTGAAVQRRHCCSTQGPGGRHTGGAAWRACCMHVKAACCAHALWHNARLTAAGGAWRRRLLLLLRGGASGEAQRRSGGDQQRRGQAGRHGGLCAQGVVRVLPASARSWRRWKCGCDGCKRSSWRRRERRGRGPRAAVRALADEGPKRGTRPPGGFECMLLTPRGTAGAKQAAGRSEGSGCDECLVCGFSPKPSPVAAVGQCN